MHLKPPLSLSLQTPLFWQGFGSHVSTEHKHDQRMLVSSKHNFNTITEFQCVCVCVSSCLHQRRKKANQSSR